MGKINIIDVRSKKNVIKICEVHNRIPQKWDRAYKLKDDYVKESIKRFQESLNNNRLFCRAVFKSEKIISYIWAEITKSDEDIVNIGSLWTKKNYRNRGFAQKLKKQMHSWAKKSGCKRILTQVNPKNKNMLNLNKKMNYTKTWIKMEKRL